MSGGEGLINAVHHARDVMQSAAHRVNDAVDLLYAVGLDRLADRLALLPEDLHKAGKALSNAYDADLSERLRDSQEMTGNLLLATLAGAIRPAEGRANA